MNFSNAGGTSGGVGRFFVGLMMIFVGLYLLLSSIQVVNPFHMGFGLYNFGGFRLTSGMILIPFAIGIVMVFQNGRSMVGWLLTVGSFLSLIFGVISSVQFQFRSISLFDLIVVLVLLFGGVGIFLSSFRSQ